MSDEEKFRFVRWERTGPVAEVVKIRKTGAAGKLTVKGEAKLATSTRELNVRLHPWLGDTGIEIEFELGSGDAHREGLDLAILEALRGFSNPVTLYYGELDLRGHVRASRGSLMAARMLGVKLLFTGPLEHPGVTMPYEILCRRSVNDEPTTALPEAWYVPGVRPDVPDVPGHLDGPLLAVTAALESKQSVLLVGQPGTGKTPVARAAAARRSLSLEESVLFAVAETANAAGLTGGLRAPFRAPHHSVSEAAMSGGGKSWRPGEFDLAAHGTLYLDEVPEFRPAIVEEALKLARTGRFSLVGAASPCACGYFGSSSRSCSCTAESLSRYTQRLNRAAWDVVIHLVEPSNRADRRRRD